MVEQLRNSWVPLQLLEMEEKIYLGSLGTLKVRDRLPWRSAIQYGGYDRQCDALAWGGRSTSAVDTPFESRLQSVGASREGSPDRDRAAGKQEGEGGSKRESTGSNPSNAAAAAELRKVKCHFRICSVFVCLFLITFLR